jgi:hypothetical protein
LTTFKKIDHINTHVKKIPPLRFRRNPESFSGLSGWPDGFKSGVPLFRQEKLANLWGLTAQKEAVSNNDYEWLMFGSSYTIGLIVMLIVSYLMRRLQGEKNPA